MLNESSKVKERGKKAVDLVYMTCWFTSINVHFQQKQEKIGMRHSDLIIDFETLSNTKKLL